MCPVCEKFTQSDQLKANFLNEVMGRLIQMLLGLQGYSLLF